MLRESERKETVVVVVKQWQSNEEREASGMWRYSRVRNMEESHYTSVPSKWGWKGQMRKISADLYCSKPHLEPRQVKEAQKVVKRTFME